MCISSISNKVDIKDKEEKWGIYILSKSQPERPLERIDQVPRHLYSEKEISLAFVFVTHTLLSLLLLLQPPPDKSFFSFFVEDYI